MCRPIVMLAIMSVYAAVQWEKQLRTRCFVNSATGAHMPIFDNYLRKNYKLLVLADTAKVLGRRCDTSYTEIYVDLKSLPKLPLRYTHTLHPHRRLHSRNMISHRWPAAFVQMQTGRPPSVAPGTLITSQTSVKKSVEPKVLGSVPVRLQTFWFGSNSASERKQITVHLRKPITLICQENRNVYLQFLSLLIAFVQGDHFCYNLNALVFFFDRLSWVHGFLILNLVIYRGG